MCGALWAVMVSQRSCFLPYAFFLCHIFTQTNARWTLWQHACIHINFCESVHASQGGWLHLQLSAIRFCFSRKCAQRQCHWLEFMKTDLQSSQNDLYLCNYFAWIILTKEILAKHQRAETFVSSFPPSFPPPFFPSAKTLISKNRTTGTGGKEVF